MRAFIDSGMGLALSMVCFSQFLVVSPKDYGTFIIMSIENHPIPMEEGQLLGTLIPLQSSLKITGAEEVCELQATERIDNLLL